MRYIVFFLVAIGFFTDVQAQNFAEKTRQHRKQYAHEFLSDAKSPLKKRDLKFLRFYTPDSTYRVMATLKRVTDTSGFDMHTHNGLIKKYFVFGILHFTLKNQACSLYVYQSERLLKTAGFEDYLFIPFTDETNYTETFGGGRYLDIRTSDIDSQGQVWIDFNRCYNPYCAFKGGYACPIPPRENDLKYKITAGEKLFGKKVKSRH
jgi:uncharacterized protein (DUF1684 family)